MKKFVVVLLLGAFTLVGCSQGGGDCGSFLQYCEPEETTEAPGGGVPIPPGGGQVGGSGQDAGEIGFVVTLVDNNNVPLGFGVSLTITHTLANQNDIPTVEDPYTHAMMPSPYGFVVSQTPFAYIFKVKSDTVSASFSVQAVAPLGSRLRCEFVDAVTAAPIPGTVPNEAYVTTEIDINRGFVSVTCLYTPVQ